MFLRFFENDDLDFDVHVRRNFFLIFLPAASSISKIFFQEEELKRQQEEILNEANRPYQENRFRIRSLEVDFRYNFSVKNAMKIDVLNVSHDVP